MTLVGGGIIALALENMSQVTTAVGADNLCSCHTESAVLMTDDGARDAVKIGRPAATRAELVARLVKRCITTCAGVHTVVWLVLVELS